jgi:hypothetical protein
MTQRGITVGGIATALGIVLAALGIMAAIGWSPGQAVTRDEAEKTYERKAEALIVHTNLEKLIERLEPKLDALVQSNVKAQTKLEEIERQKKDTP